MVTVADHGHQTMAAVVTGTVVEGLALVVEETETVLGMTIDQGVHHRLEHLGAVATAIAEVVRGFVTETGMSQVGNVAGLDRHTAEAPGTETEVLARETRRRRMMTPSCLLPVEVRPKFLKFKLSFSKIWIGQ